MERLPFGEARRRCLEQAVPRESIWVSLQDAIGQFTAEAVLLPDDVPPFSRSLMDGFAVRASDTTGASEHRPVVLEVTDEVPAGSWPAGCLGTGQAVRTMTGAPLAPGADAVIPFESVRYPAGSGRRGEHIQVVGPVRTGESVQQQGEDLRRGTRPIPPGCCVGAAEAAVLATAGVWRLRVVRRPRIGILSTGNELLHGPGVLKPGQIRNSNSPMLFAMLRRLGFEAVDLGPCEDSVHALAETAGRALEELDVVVTTGGVSVGDYDVVPEAMAALGMDVLFRQVAMRPGKPLTLAGRQHKMWFALPGNPAAAYVTGYLFLVPALRKMSGASAWDLPRTTAVLTGRPRHDPKPLTVLWRGFAWLEQGEFRVDAGREQSSMALSSFLGANALVEVEPHTQPELGSLVTVWILPEMQGF